MMAVPGMLMILALVLLIGLIVAFVRGGSTARWVIALVFLLAVFGTLFSVRSVGSAQHATVVNRVEHETWRHASEYLLESDIYPSARSAAKGLAAEIAPMLASVAPAGQKPQSLIVRNTEKVDRSLAHAAAEVLRARAPGIEVEVVPADADAGALQLKLDLGGAFQTSIEGVLKESGRQLQAELKGPAGTLERSARFVDKPWVDEFGQFIAEQPDGTYLLAQSPTPAVHPGEALSLAMLDASNQLVAHIETRMAGQRRDPGHIQSLHNAVMAEVNQGRFIHDRFIQQFNRPSGTVYQASLLIKPDAAALDRIAEHQQSVTVAVHYRQRSSIFAGIAMLGVICVLYGFLNLATKGYYAASLKVAAGLAIVFALLVLAMLA